MRSEDTQGVQGGRAGLYDFVHMADDAEIAPEGDTEDAHRIDSEHTSKRGWRLKTAPPRNVVGLILYIYIYTCIHTYIHTYIHTCIHAYIHTFYIHAYTYIHTYIRTYT